MKYRLLKDLPGYPVDTVFQKDPKLHSGWQLVRDTSNTVYAESVNVGTGMFLDVWYTDSDWFEPIKEKEAQKPWKVTLTDNYSVEDNRAIVVELAATEAQAEAVSASIKALLEYVHGKADEIAWPDVMEPADKARKAVQEEV